MQFMGPSNGGQVACADQETQLSDLRQIVTNQLARQLSKMRIRDSLFAAHTIPEGPEAPPQRMRESSEILAHFGTQIAPNTRTSSLLHHV